MVKNYLLQLLNKENYNTITSAGDDTDPTSLENAVLVNVPILIRLNVDSIMVLSALQVNLN